MLIKVCQHMHDEKKERKNRYSIEVSNAKCMTEYAHEDQDRQMTKLIIDDQKIRKYLQIPLQ